MSRRVKQQLWQCIERLERRTLLAAPVASNDSYTGKEDQPIVVSAGITNLTFNGNSSIYNGSHTWTEADGTFTGDGSGDYAHVHFQGTGATTDNWDLWFAPPPEGPALTATSYPNAVRFLFQGTGQPGLDITGNGNSSNTVTGQFTVLQYEYDESGNIVNFSANFEHHANGGAPQVTGTVNFHYVPAGFKSGVLANDTDADNNALTASLVTAPTHGTLALFSDGTLNYLPDDDWSGTDSFTYRANDGTTNSNLATVTLTVLPVNDQPTFTAGANLLINEDVPLQTVNNWATQLNKGATDESGQTLSFLVTGNTNPALFQVAPAIDSTGKLTFTPKANAFGIAQITVALKDNGGTANGGVDTSDPVTFTITVTGVNDAPVAVNDAYSTGQNQAIVIPPTAVTTSLILNSAAGDPIGQGVSKTLTASSGTFLVQLNNDNGVSVFFQGNGTTSTENWWLDFTAPGPNKLQVGTYLTATLYPFQSDSQVGMKVYVNGRAPLSITGQFTVKQIVYDVNGNITNLSADFQQFANGSAAALSGTINYNYKPKTGLLTNDTDADGDPLTASVVAAPTHGTLSLNADGSFTYTPANSYVGNDSFTYRANDGTVNSNTATSTLTVGAPALSVTATTPTNGSTALATTTAPTVTFNRSIQPATLVFTLTDSASNVIPATVTYDDTTKTATLTPTSQLWGSSTYTASVSGAKDLSNNTMSGAVVWSFSTTFAWKVGTTLNVQFDSIGSHIFLRSGSGVVATEGGISQTFTGVVSTVVTGTIGDDVIEFAGLGVPLAFNGGAGHDTLNVNTSTCTLVGDAGAATSNLTVNVKSGAALLFNTTQHLENLLIPGGKATMASAVGKTLYTRGLSISAGGKLDLNDNDLVAGYSGASPFTTLQTWVLDGYSASPDSTKTGFVSTTSQNTGGQTILALFDNALAGFTEYPPGSGNSIAAASIVGKYTYLGDSNLDGQVTPQDYTAIDSNLGTTPPVGLAWFYGDLNFDGQVTPQDYAAIDSSLGLGVGNPLAAASYQSPIIFNSVPAALSLKRDLANDLLQEL
jgi:VCBS repeat-containing protein